MKKNILPIIGLSAILMLSGCSSSSKDASANFATSTVTEAMAPSFTSSSGNNYDYGYGADLDYAFEEEIAFDDMLADSKLEVKPSANGSSYSNGQAAQTADKELAELPTTGRKLIKNVNLSMQTLNFDKTIKGIEQEISYLGGYIQDSNTYQGSYNYYTDTFEKKNRTSNYTVRIPAAKLDAFTTAIGDLGSIYRQNMSTEDVTLSYLDTESRAKSLKIQQERLFALLEKAETIDEIISLEDRISNVTYQLERKESMLKNYDNLVEFSTVYLSIEEVSHITIEDPQTFGERISSGLSTTFYDLGEDIKDFVAWFIIDLPYIVIWVIIIIILILIVKKIFKKKSSNKKAKKTKEATSIETDSKPIEDR